MLGFPGVALRSMASPSSPHWKLYERLVAALHKKLDPNAKVSWDTKVKGKGGNMRQIDVMVEGRVGSAPILLVVECKRYASKVGVELIDGFIGKLSDVGADKGVIVSKSGFTRDALQRAEHGGVIACVLRPAKDEDWQGYLRSLQLRVASRVTLLEGLTLNLSDGRSISSSGMFQVDQNGKPEFVDIIIKRRLSENPRPDGDVVEMEFPSPYRIIRDDGKDVRVLNAVFRPRQIDAFQVDALVVRPEDWVFMREHSDGRVDEEKTFFVFAELEALAKGVKQSKQGL